jgi:hypothetical protein
MKDKTVLIGLLEMISVGISMKDINSAKGEKLSRNKMVKGKKMRFRLSDASNDVTCL